MKGFIRLGLSTYQMVEVSPEHIDELIAAGREHMWPHHFDRDKRIWPPPPPGAEVFFAGNSLSSASEAA